MIIGDVLITEPIYNILNRLQIETGNIKNIRETIDNIMVTCPIHKGGQENKPSCGILTKNKKEMKGGKVVTYEEGTVNCFTCGYQVTFPEYVSNVLGYDDGGIEGTKWLLSNYGVVEIENRHLDIEFKRGNKIENPISIIPDEELAKYRYIHPYMYKRGLTDELIEYFDVGYDKEEKCLTFPVNNIHGECIFIQKRSVNGKFFKNKDTPKGETLFGIDKVYENIEKVDKLFITESILDAITVWKYGGYAVSMMGLVLLPKQKEILLELPVRSFVIATDGDEYGINAKEKIRKKLKNYKLLYHFKYPEGCKDINDLSEKQFNELDLKIF